MWKVIGLLALAALFVDINAEIVAPSCPTLSHQDEYYYITDLADKFYPVSLSQWTGVEANSVDDLVCNYYAGKLLKVIPGECEIKCHFPDCNEEFVYTIYVINKTSCSEQDVPNGQLVAESYVVGSTATVSCEPQYKPEGPEGVCLRNVDFAALQKGATEEGIGDPGWEGVPTCVKISCGKPAEGVNTVQVNDDVDVEIGESYSYQCIDNYGLDDPNSLSVSCIQDPNEATNAIFSSSPPSCEEIKCGTPGAVSNTEPVTVSEASIGQSYTYQCSENYAPQGSLEVECARDGESSTASWSIATGTCNEIKCGTPGAVANTEPVTITEGTIGGEPFTYVCSEDYAPEGSLTVNCVRNSAGTDTAVWSTLNGQCTEIKCGTPGAVANTEPVTITEGTIGQSYTYQCSENYAPQGSLEVECARDGESSTASWSIATGTCNEIKCGKPEEGKNTKPVSIKEGALGATYTYECKDGFNKKDSLTVTCEASGSGKNKARWSPLQGTCIKPKVNCPEGFEYLEQRESSHCVKFQEEDQSWEIHARRCKLDGGLLAVPVSRTDLRALATYQSSKTKDPVWYGPQALFGDNVFRNFDNEPLRFSNFKNDRSKRSGQCVYVKLNKEEYVDDCCWNRRPAICEAHSLGPKECHEARGYELSDGRCYTLITDEASFEEQCAKCHRLNGQLAPALTSKQNTALKKFFQSKLPSGKDYEVWIGMHNMVDRSTLQSVDLRSSSFENFAGSGYSVDDRCVTINKDGWGKDCCFERLGAVCELNLCDKGYVQEGNNCYKVVGSTEGSSSWETNCRRCRRDGGNLVSFSQASDVDDFLRYIGGARGDLVGGSDLWIGCHDQANEGVYQTSDLKEFSFFGDVSRPTKNSDGQDCCALTEGGVASQCCFSCQRGVCAKPLKTPRRH